MYRLFIEDDLQQYTAAEIESIIATLPPQRREVAMRYKHMQGQMESAVSYRLLCKALMEVYGINGQPTFQANAHGKPSMIEYPDIHFNLSHCKHAILCAVSDFPIGVDVERIGRYNETLASYCMNSLEIQQIKDSLHPELEFTKLWTQKEAVVKLRGTGLAEGVKDILTNARGIRVQTFVQEDKGYVYSVATYEQPAQG